MLRVQDFSLDQFVLGCILSIVGLLIIIFHKRIRAWRDYWASKDFPLGYGEMWTGLYTRGGLIFTYAVIIMFGLAFFGFGVLQIITAFTR